VTRNPAVWLTEKAKTGVADLPRNAAWLASKTLGPPAEAAADGVADGGRALRRTAQKALPGHDRVDARLDDARAAVERAHLAEREAVKNAEAAHELAEQVRLVEKQHRERLAVAARERDDAVEARVGDARRRADEAVEAERSAAESEEGARLRSLEDDLAAELREVEARAQAAQDQAREDIAAAEQQMAEARRVSDEAAEAAMEAAREAHLAAAELAARADAQAVEVDQRVQSAQELRRDAAATTSALEGVDGVADVTGPLRERTIAELLPIAAGLGIEGRSRMRHDELVSAITRARSRETRATTAKNGAGQRSKPRPAKTAAARPSAKKTTTASAKRTAAPKKRSRSGSANKSTSKE
jgi:hypothetical protein